jgi:hypothetical protein
MFNRYCQAELKPTPPMPTFAEIYCAQTGCAPPDFNRRVFWQTLPWHAVPLAPLLLLGDHFASDQGMIDACGRATRLQQINEEIDDYHFQPQNSGWLRRFAHFRISTRRLRQLAERYLAQRKLSRESPVGVNHAITADRPAENSQPEARPIFRATAIRSLPPFTPGFPMGRVGFLKTLRPQIQP